MSEDKKRVHVFVVSDATGVTAERVIKAVLVQFDQIEPIFSRFPFVKSGEVLAAVLSQAESVSGLVVYSLVAPDLRRFMRRQKGKVKIQVIDLLGPLLSKLGDLWDLMPSLHPGLLDEMAQKSIRLAESIDFTLKHDDGQGLETLEEADLIILGVSRTSKTPTSLYLSCNHNLKVANIPIVMGAKPPDKIFGLPNRKLGFTIAAETLAFLRQRRFKYAGLDSYADLGQIRRELDFSHQIFARLKGLQIIEVTNLPIEEIANRVL